ncbi:hypothetical protein MGG_17359 [Pyricularia oryzae 70-15]|uniref:Uncharacterized protein n=1 Tax=Pyricularia oryzae (strain 70-15 / ATCC MYA-4617 / FGSC 8958) TaxID=242507 RepID=G4NE03_PYRO7|nr:uncharacterized protein MGG_17359 [Pyricularia oryzae 70-15]EHA48538.1 hypothetical protein MGG_17359 [Pyricularia oryzae 70-15]
MDTQTFRADAAIFSPGPRSECGQKPPEDLETNFVGDQLEFARLDSSTYAITIVGTRVLYVFELCAFSPKYAFIFRASVRVEAITDALHS